MAKPSSGSGGASTGADSRLNALRNELRQEMRLGFQEINERYFQLAQANAIENVIEHGFERMAVYLQPLADLTARRVPLKEPEASNLAQIRAALARPDWRDLRPSLAAQDTEQKSQKRMTAS